MKTGDMVQLKTPDKGRLFSGRIIKINNGLIRVALPNGLYAEFPEKMWQYVEEKNDEEVSV